MCEYTAVAWGNEILTPHSSHSPPHLPFQLHSTTSSSSYLPLSLAQQISLSLTPSLLACLPAVNIPESHCFLPKYISLKPISRMNSTELSMQSPVDDKKAGVSTFVAQWPVYSLGWSVRRDKGVRLAIGSFLEDHSNKVELVRFDPDVSDFTSDSRLAFDHPYAPTNIMFFPSEDPSYPDLIATSGDYLRVWEICDERTELKALLNGNKSSEFSSSITSFDWASFDARRIATCSVDTTCTIWDVEREVVDAQLVAHDKEVYDVSWGGFNVFASVSGDGSVRVFDLRDKERSTIIYENPATDSPLLRLEWNKADPKSIATVGMDSSKVIMLDIRFPTTPLMELNRHKASVNAISWAPSVGRQLCSVGDDARVFIWDVIAAGFRPENTGEVEPEVWYGSVAEINNVRWSPAGLDWIAITFLNKLQLLKV